MDWDRAIAIGLSNPFEVAAAQQAQAGTWFESAEAPACAKRLLEAGRRDETERLLLAAGHFEARSAAAQPNAVLGPERYKEKLWRSVGRSRAQFVRVCCASARCCLVLDELKGTSAALTAVRRDVWSVCFGQSLLHALQLERVIHDHDVLIQGETGTGKEIVARAIQQGTPGGVDGGLAPAATLNAAAVPDTLIQSELFGHARGAFTGASEARMGRLRSAHKGSFFLDELGDLGPSTQVALLRVMETNEVAPLGSDTTHQVYIRYLAATHADLAEQVERGRFRRDLYERIAGNEVHLPPLRQRPEDIIAIGEAFFSRYVTDSTAVDRTRLRAWLEQNAEAGHAWRGNVRQLENNLRDLMLGLEPRITHGVGKPSGGVAGENVPAAVAEGSACIEDVQRWYLEHVIARQGGNLLAAARVLGIDRSTAYRWRRGAST